MAERFTRRKALAVLASIPAVIVARLPTRFELVVNARTAKTLGITLSPALLSRADRVVQ